jgi:hypothetical protein
VIDFDFVGRAQHGKPGNYHGSSQAMESAILTEMVKRFVGDAIFAGFVHDQDAKAWKVVKDLNWNVKEYFDKGHVFKSGLLRIWQACNSVAVDAPAKGRGKAKKKWALTGLKVPLTKHLRYCINKVFDSEDERKKQWFGAFEYFVHPKSEVGAWQLREIPASQAQLRQFLKEMWALIPQMQSLFTTQGCESLNASKARTAPKGLNFTESWNARCAMAVLMLNEGRDCILELLKDMDCYSDLAPHEIEAITSEAAKMAHQQKARQKPKELDRRRHTRKNTRERKERETEMGSKKACDVEPIALLPAYPANVVPNSLTRPAPVHRHRTLFARIKDDVWPES